MKPIKLSLAALAALPLAEILPIAPTARAQDVVTQQEIKLVDGWNAVWLEVQSTYSDGHPRAGQPRAPEDVFPAQVETVITPRPLAGLAEFFADDPTHVGTFNQAGWEQWHNPTAVGDNLALITGNRPYLLEVNGNQTFTVEGRVRFHRPVWTPDRYNLVGFGLDGAPTFQDFFGPSDGRHPIDRIYRLDPASGNWKGVLGTDQMTSNEAYWIFTSGPSDYMGPVTVGFDGSGTGSLHFGAPTDAVTVDEGVDAMDLDLKGLAFSNLGTAAAEPTLELVSNLDADAGNPGDLTLFAVRPTTGNLGFQTVTQVDSTPDDESSPDLQETVQPQTTAILTIGAKRNWSTGRVGRTNLYRLRTGAGAEFWLPVTALNNDLQLPTDLMQTDAAAVAGLWVGEVSVNAATSIVVDGAPVRPAAAPAPVSILLHSDGGGLVRLLSQVTIMQTRTADPNLPSAPVLVVDRHKIPFFEGIKERNGKRVGVRLEAVAFDMPRDLSVEAQGDWDTFTLTDCETEMGATNVTCLSTANLTPGMRISGPTIPLGTTVVSVDDEQPTFEISAPATESAESLSLTVLFGDPDSDDLIDMLVDESNNSNPNWLNGKTGNPPEPRYPVRDSVDRDAIDSYLLFRGLRPPALKEVYQLSLSLEGALGAGKTVQTNPGTLNLDPFHRSNPFRHAFHQRHPKGPKITREFSIVFDLDQSISDHLRGTYTETVKGLTKTDLTVTGTIHLSRVSTVDMLDPEP